MRLRRRDAEGAVEATIQALYRSLEFIRDQDQSRHDDNVLLHRPRQLEPQTPAQFEERKATS
jgi:hypothetical protein